VVVSVPGGASTYCIDATEVTQAQYAAFLAAKAGDTGGQASHCAWNSSFQPAASNGDCTASSFTPSTRPHHPVTCVDWCDAVAYCKWAGMRLCGAIGGGATDYKNQNLPSKSQWHNACSSSGVNTYTYGNSFNPLACNGVDYGASSTIAVTQAVACRPPSSPFRNVRDMSGNVWEWEDACKKYSSPSDTCHVRGGGFATSTLQCSRELMIQRNAVRADVGFRCCD
jgi:formylglycine-generating enzyme required for sulfatase activity